MNGDDLTTRARAVLAETQTAEVSSCGTCPLLQGHPSGVFDMDECAHPDGGFAVNSSRLYPPRECPLRDWPLVLTLSKSAKQRKRAR